MYYVLCTASPVRAASVDPFPPFSVEGNPPEDYFFQEIFPLFRYIRPPALEIYENKDRSRTYDDVEVCGGGDHRDPDCSVDAETGQEIDGCDGGDVDICLRGTDDKVSTAHSGPNNSCNASKSKPSPTMPMPKKGVNYGKCSYVQKPSQKQDVKGADFSTTESLVYPKIQSAAGIYSHVGSDNAITWGASHLQLTEGQKIINQLVVLKRAKQTKATLNQTGEWPLGWVDWGFITPNGKTLITIHDELPGGISAAGGGIVEGIDDFYLTGGNLAIVSDTSDAQDYVVETVTKELAKKTPATWALDLAQTPLYSPSFRQSYVRSSICVWAMCCPNPSNYKCPVEPQGTLKGLSYDTTISQAFGGALNSLFLTYSLDDGVKLFKKIVATNPLVRFATSAAVNATPSKINERLSRELEGDCLKYIPWSNWNSFGSHIDYLKPGNFLGPGGTCPDYQIYPSLTKENAEAFSLSPFAALISLIWGQKEDEVSVVKKHLITIPEAMGQSISDIQQPFYDTRDTLAELDSVKDYNANLSNSIDDSAAYLIGGQTSIPGMALRLPGYYSCADDMFSAQLKTSIKDYVHGIRPGCDQASVVPEGKCDGKLFGELIAGSRYQVSSNKGQTYFDSSVKPLLTPELMNTYAEAEKQTGVPCEILAGIHFVEAANNPTGSLVSGRQLGTPEPDAGGKVFKTLIETAIYAGNHLKGKVGGNLQDAQAAITALSRYNGGGNSNCQLGYPYSIPYGGCPRAFEGEDDPYPMSFVDSKHDSMYLLYCADHTACAPQIFDHPGSFAVALGVYNSMTKSGYDNSQLPKTQPTPPASTTSSQPTTTTFFPKSCGEGSLGTALGCIPYTRDAFVGALLSFIVGIAGAIALVTMLVATIQMMTAGGNAKQLQKGKELFASAIVGLLFLIFSVSLLRLIAGDIIKLPGF